MAIAFDAATDGGNATGTSHTFSHTCTGANRALAIGVVGDVTSGGNDDITGVTYNGVACAFVAKVTSTINRFLYLYLIVAPASGANNVVISAGSSHFLAGVAASYTGVGQTGQPDASVSGALTTSAITGTVTTVADNCWLVGTAYHNFTGNPLAAGTNTVERVEDATFTFLGMYDSNAAQTPAGSYSLQVTHISTAIGIIVMSLAPPGAAGNPFYAYRQQ